MGRPRRFDRAQVVELAMGVFAAKGFARASLRELSTAMRINKQSLYNTFGDKRALYLECLKEYCERRYYRRAKPLMSSSNGLEAIVSMLTKEVDEIYGEGKDMCLELASIVEFGAADPGTSACRAKTIETFQIFLNCNLNDAIKDGSIRAIIDVESASIFIETVLYGMRAAARAGMPAETMRKLPQYVEQALAANPDD